MSEQKDLREIGKYSNDTTKSVLEALQAAQSSGDWPRAVITGLSQVWRGVENQNYVEDILAAFEQVGRTDEVVTWAFSDSNDDLLGAAILAAWAFQRSGSRRVIQIVASGVRTMPPPVRWRFLLSIGRILKRRHGGSQGLDLGFAIRMIPTGNAESKWNNVSATSAFARPTTLKGLWMACCSNCNQRHECFICLTRHFHQLPKRWR